LASRENPYGLFYEIKANLKREQVQLLAKAGVRWIQPGIESLDDRILSLIAKGNSCVINLQLLKWCREFDIHAAWNLLSGVPGESDGWYMEMAEWLPAICHLQPPSGVCRIRFDRFSPYHMRPHDFGLTLEPSRAYEYVYRLPKASLMRLAYSFEDSGRSRHVHRAMQSSAGQEALARAVGQWNYVWQTEKPVLLMSDDGSELHFTDTRPGAEAESWVADGLEAEIYRRCDYAQAVPGLLKQLSAHCGREVLRSEADAAIDSLRRKKVLLDLRGKLLSVAVNSR
jgi:ribosomal peptide maturation radical SAM protein 1